jgi:hypothetical protein
VQVEARSVRARKPRHAIAPVARTQGTGDRVEHGGRQAPVVPGGVRIAELGPDVLAAYDSHGLVFVNINTPHGYARARGSRDRITKDGSGSPSRARSKTDD